MSDRSNVSSVRNGIRGRIGKSSGLLASGKHTSRYGGVSSNCNNNIKRSARNVRGWVSERSNVSSVRNGNDIRGRVESGRGWARGRAENSVRQFDLFARRVNSVLKQVSSTAKEKSIPCYVRKENL